MSCFGQSEKIRPLTFLKFSWVKRKTMKVLPPENNSIYRVDPNRPIRQRWQIRSFGCGRRIFWALLRIEVHCPPSYDKKQLKRRCASLYQFRIGESCINCVTSTAGGFGLIFPSNLGGCWRRYREKATVFPRITRKRRKILVLGNAKFFGKIVS